MKKKSLLLVTAAMLLASCGSTPAASTVTSGAASSATSQPEASLSIPDAGYALKVWCPEAAQTLTTSQINTYLTEKGLDSKVTVTVTAVGEGDAATNMITDVDAGADMYFFAQDQLARLVGAGALAQIGGSYATAIANDNDAGAVSAAQLNGDTYAFPLTSDNGYFLYYDKTALDATAISNWANIVSYAETNSKTIGINYTSAWYNFGFFYGAGADSVFSTDKDGNFTSVNDTYNSAKGLVAARAMANIITSKTMVDTGSISGVTDTCVAVVDGTWDYTAAQKLFGDKLGCAKLPSYTVGGKDYQMGSFCGNKLLGVKPQSDSVKAALLNRIAAYLTGETGQAERFASLEWGPSNKAVQGSDAVKAAPQLVALAAQNAYGKPQGQFPGGWWTLAGGIGTSIQAAGKDVTDAALQTILDTYETAVQDLVKAA